MTTGPDEDGSTAGTGEAAESPTLDGYGNDTGFAEEAEQADPEVAEPTDDTDD